MEPSRHRRSGGHEPWTDLQQVSWAETDDSNGPVEERSVEPNRFGGWSFTQHGAEALFWICSVTHAAHAAWIGGLPVPRLTHPCNVTKWMARSSPHDVLDRSGVHINHPQTLDALYAYIDPQKHPWPHRHIWQSHGVFGHMHFWDCAIYSLKALGSAIPSTLRCFGDRSSPAAQRKPPAKPLGRSASRPRRKLSAIPLGETGYTGEGTTRW